MEPRQLRKHYRSLLIRKWHATVTGGVVAFLLLVVTVFLAFGEAVTPGKKFPWAAITGSAGVVALLAGLVVASFQVWRDEKTARETIQTELNELRATEGLRLGRLAELGRLVQGIAVQMRVIEMIANDERPEWPDESPPELTGNDAQDALRKQMYEQRMAEQGVQKKYGDPPWKAEAIACIKRARDFVRTLDPHFATQFDHGSTDSVDVPFFADIPGLMDTWQLLAIRKARLLAFQAEIAAGRTRS